MNSYLLSLASWIKNVQLDRSYAGTPDQSQGWSILP